MSQRFYLQPSAFLYGTEAEQAVRGGEAGRVAGARIGFTQVFVHTRDAGGSRSELRAYADLRTSGEDAILSVLDAIEQSRAELPGLASSGTAVMGIVNVTPDSFSDGGSFSETDAAVTHGRDLIEAGADILDIGGESTRPGSDETPEDEERARVLPVIAALSGTGVPVSIDTRKSSLMRAAAEAGAAIVNDVSALRHDPASLSCVRELGLPVVLMHSRGDPKTMQEDPVYENVVLDVYDELADRVQACVAGGIDRQRIVVDPGIGFGKTFAHNHELLRALSIFHGLGTRVMLGASRKAFIGALSGEPQAGRRMAGSVSVALMGAMQGVQIVRVHDVRETVQALRTWSGIQGL